MTLALWTLAGLLAGGVAMLAILRPRWALLVLVVVAASNASGVLGSLQGVSIYVLVLALASAGLLLGLLTGRLHVHLSPVLLLAAMFLAAQAPSVLLATDRAAAFAGLLGLTKDLWFLAVVVLLTTATANAWTLARAFTATMAVLAALTVANEFVLGNTTTFWGFAVVSDSTGVGVATARHAGPFEDPNFWGRLLLLAIPLAVALLAEAWQRAARRAVLCWGGAGLFLLGALYLTQSRGALLGLAVAVTLFLVLLGPRSRRMVLVLPAVLGLLLLLPGVGSRLATLAEVAGDSSGPQDYSLVERTATQQISLAIFLDHPAAGVGLGNIPAVWDDYSDRADIVVERVVAPHNLYLQLAAEGGLLGLGGAMVFFVGVMVIALRVAWAYPAGTGARAAPERVLAVGAVAAFAGWGVASLFLHLSQLRVLLVAIAVVAVLDSQRTRRRRTAADAMAPDAHGAPWIRMAAATAVALGVATVGALAFNAVSQQVWVARVPVTVLPQPSPAEGGLVEPYTHEVITLPTVLLTYAAAIEHTGLSAVNQDGSAVATDGYTVQVDEASASALLVVEVHGNSRQTATGLAEAVASNGTSQINRNPALSRLATATAGASSAELGRDWSLQRLAVLACAVPAGIWLVSILTRRRHSGRIPAGD
jgi:O-antigen ligase